MGAENRNGTCQVTHSPKKSTYELIETGAASTEAARVYTKSSAFIL